MQCAGTMTVVERASKFVLLVAGSTPSRSSCTSRARLMKLARAEPRHTQWPRAAPLSRPLPHTPPSLREEVYLPVCELKLSLRLDWKGDGVILFLLGLHLAQNMRLLALQNCTCYPPNCPETWLFSHFFTTGGGGYMQTGGSSATLPHCSCPGSSTTPPCW